MLDGCLSRLGFADEIVVVLDRCTDRSAEIAHAHADQIIEGGWEIEGERRNLGIQACTGEWIVEIDADEWVDELLAQEIRAAIRSDEFDAYDIPVDNYIGKRLVRHGWGGGSFGAVVFPGLFRKGRKRWENYRVHPHIVIDGKLGRLKNGVAHYVDRDISDMLARLDRYTTAHGKDMAARGDTKRGLGTMFRKFTSRFWKIYFVRKAYKERELGIMIALCGALYPLISHIKAVEEESQRS